MKAIAEALARGELPDALNGSTDDLDNAPATPLDPVRSVTRGGKEAMIAFHSTGGFRLHSMKKAASRAALLCAWGHGWLMRRPFDPR